MSITKTKIFKSCQEKQQITEIFTSYLPYTKQGTRISNIQICIVYLLHKWINNVFMRAKKIFLAKSVPEKNISTPIKIWFIKIFGVHVSLSPSQHKAAFAGSFWSAGGLSWVVLPLPMPPQSPIILILAPLFTRFC